jgi:hypothetical protein
MLAIPEFELACSLHPSGKLTISVSLPPPRGWARLRWRFEQILRLT